MIPNHYQTLEIAPSATKQNIKTAYRLLALKYHPDKNKSSDAHEKFIVINEAYLILYDDEARIKYDREYKMYYEREIDQKYNSNSKENRANHESKNPSFEDDDLNRWTKNARTQAENYAKMKFVDFSNLILGMIKETGFQLGNSFLLMIGVLLSLGGCGNIVIGIFSKGNIGNPILGIIFLPIGIFLYSLSQKNYTNHK